MKNLYAVFLCLVLSAFASGLAPAGFDGNSAVEVIVGSGHGSGVYIGGNYVLTAGHVAQGVETVTVKRQRDGGWADTWEADVVWVDSIHDFALLKIKAVMPDDVPAAKMNCAKPVLGQDVDIVGWPLDLGRITSRGYVASADSKRGDWKNSYIIVAPVTFGNSGGPVYNKDGAVIGLIVGIIRTTSLSIMAPVEPICSVIPK